MQQVLWLIVIAVAIVLLVAIIVRAIANRRRPAFDVRALPASYVGAYQARIAELQALFAEHPREAVAGAKQLVDDMTLRMGYPTRMTDRERLDDIGSIDRRHGERYKLGMALKADSTTEEMRRALMGYLDLAKELVGRSARDTETETVGRREIAG